MNDSVQKIQITDLSDLQEISDILTKDSDARKEIKEYDDKVINKSLEFTQQLLLNWLEEHRIQVSVDPNTYINDILEKIYHKQPELLYEEQLVN